MIFLYKNIKIFIYLSLLVFTAAPAYARQVVAMPATGDLTLECISHAANAHQVPLAALLGILATEGGQPGQALSNKNGTWDMGPFQINTCHINELLEIGLEPQAIMTDSCLNAYAAGWLLRKQLNRSKTLWEAIGAYHSRTAYFHNRYIKRLQNNLSKLNSGRVLALLEYANGKRRSW